jgi:ComF family protein
MQAIHALKYANQPHLAPLLGRYLVAAFARCEWHSLTIDAIVPVPLHSERFTARGYNQSALLAAHLAQAAAIPLQVAWIERHRDTRPQVGLTHSERQQNVCDSFTAQPVVCGKHLLLVDDVYTTGATLRACAAAARQAGATAAYALTVARPLLPSHAVGPLEI